MTWISSTQTRPPLKQKPKKRVQAVQSTRIFIFKKPVIKKGYDHDKE
ncbi:MAG: hypothetical protein ABI324_18665 [Ktedonobacteraceae bacterium]